MRGAITFGGLPGQAAYEHFAAEIELLIGYILRVFGSFSPGVIRDIIVGVCTVGYQHSFIHHCSQHSNLKTH